MGRGQNFSLLHLESVGSAMGLLVVREVGLGLRHLAREDSRREVGLVPGAGGFSKVKKRLEGVVMSFHLP